MEETLGSTLAWAKGKKNRIIFAERKRHFFKIYFIFQNCRQAVFWKRNNRPLQSKLQTGSFISNDSLLNTGLCEASPPGPLLPSCLETTTFFLLT